MVARESIRMDCNQHIRIYIYICIYQIECSEYLMSGMPFVRSVPFQPRKQWPVAVHVYRALQCWRNDPVRRQPPQKRSDHWHYKSQLERASLASWHVLLSRNPKPFLRHFRSGPLGLHTWNLNSCRKCHGGVH